MAIRTVAVQSPGDMGHGVGRDLRARGFRVVACLAGRSERTRRLAAAAGMEAVASLEALLAEADLVLSILPPAAALDAARAVARAAGAGAGRPVFADCNAVAPATAEAIADVVTAAGLPFIDAGIIGWAPGRGSRPTRFYCSGPDTGPLEALGGGGMRVLPLGARIGQASALKMAYAAVTKGTMTLHAAALVTAELHGLSEAYHRELAESQPAVWEAMNRMVPRLPLDAERWIGEMHEIAATFGAAGLPPDFHRAAAAVFELLARTPIAAETRETVDETRTLADALAVYARAVRPAGEGREPG